MLILSLPIHRFMWVWSTWYQANRIATLERNDAPSGVYTQYGGVIFCRSDRSRHPQPERSQGQILHGGFRIVTGRLAHGPAGTRRKGHRSRRRFQSTSYFAETHDRVVYAVRDGYGRCGNGENQYWKNLSAEGKINLNDYYVFPQLHDVNELPTPYLSSTRLYPEWPMAKVRHTSDDLAQQVAVALLQMPPDSPAARAAGSAGWTIPLNYQPVHDCLKAIERRRVPIKTWGKFPSVDLSCAATDTGYFISLRRLLHSGRFHRSRPETQPQDQSLPCTPEDRNGSAQSKGPRN
jgi:hypothetical protein